MTRSYGAPAIEYDRRNATQTLYVGPTQPPAPSVRDMPLARTVGRIPRGYSWGAPKTGPMTGVQEFMQGMGKGNATTAARLYDGRGMTMGSKSVLSSSSSQSLSFGPAPPHLVEKTARKGGGSTGRRRDGP